MPFAPSKHDALTQCWFKVGPPSAKLDHNLSSIASMSRVYRVISMWPFCSLHWHQWFFNSSFNFQISKKFKKSKLKMVCLFEITFLFSNSGAVNPCLPTPGISAAPVVHLVRLWLVAWGYWPQPTLTLIQRRNNVVCPVGNGDRVGYLPSWLSIIIQCSKQQVHGVCCLWYYVPFDKIVAQSRLHTSFCRDIQCTKSDVKQYQLYLFH